MNAETAGNGVLWYLVFLLSVTCHEAAHAYAAHLLGDSTAYRGGQASLNPLPHIRREPFGTVIVPIVAYLSGGWMFGWASAPYDPVWSDEHPRRMGAMSLAGPLANLFLFFLAFGILRGGLAAGVLRQPESVSFIRTAVAVNESGLAGPAAMFLSVLFSLNILLCCFNLLPVPPLDGRGIVAILLPAKTAREVMRFLRHP
ncbi:MAG TPA: site-2 protease family protein, partial [Bacteroidota bacterium]|nr:site-2 protease family protein [Bacteroidota bacterium]